MKELTDKQQKVLDFIVQRIDVEGYPPTLREIGEYMGIASTNGVNDHLRALERKGVLLRGASKSRALRPMNQVKKDEVVNGETLRIPLLGRIAAGQPITAFEDYEDQLMIDASLFTAGADIFALKVRGESMIGDGILDGDVIFVRAQQQPRRGDIVAALIEEEATVKRYYPSADQIVFEPSNPAMEPIVVKRRDFRETQILGVVVGVFRQIR
ncbi:MAG: repressor LexA [Deltaproteobacteria bacterium CG2_30_63_29]|nr:MAG: repressor LexA [Deltaproteobacteria bacterium CG2_30_63_29]PJB34704.1 MAG: repressor LexA [Deltaproteobacteria bacterium CG_4_9_14_3_um_filter_63_12]